MNKQIIYEFPLNERIRVFMRLEQLFLQLNHFLAGKSVYDKRAAISVLLDILMIFSRSDLKSELMKELDRQAKVLNQLTRSQTGNAQRFNETLDEVAQASRNLYNASGKIGISAMESDLVQSISQRNSIPGGSCCFDLPAYHHWLEQSEVEQCKALDRWTQPFQDIRVAINLVLDFIRQSRVTSEEVAAAGFFQLALDKAQPAQLLQVGIDSTTDCFAEISGGKHRFSIRFMQPSSDETRPAQVRDDIVFRLSRCLF